MADIATLGLSVESGSVDKGSQSLDRLSNAAKRAEAAAQGLASGTRNAGSAAAGAASGITNAGNAAARAEGLFSRLGNAAQRLWGWLNKTRQAANDNAQAMAGGAHSVGNLAAQFQDVAVMASMSASPFQIALSQGTQLSAELGPMGAAGALRTLGAAFLSVLSPISLVTIGVVGLVAAGIQMIDWGATAAAALNAVANVLPMVADEAAVAGSVLLVAFGPQILKSIVLLTASIAHGLVSALTAVAVAAAANPFTALVLALAAVVTAAYVFRDELTKILGVDIVGAAKDGANLVIGIFVGSYNAVVDAWGNLPTFFSAIGKQAWNNLVSEFEKPALTANIFGKEMTLIPGLDLSSLKSDLSAAEQASFAGAKATFNQDLNRDYVGAIGSAISRGASAAADKIRELATGIASAGEAADEAGKEAANAAEKAAKEAQRLSDAYDKIVLGAERHIAASQAEAAALGMTAQQTATLKYQTDLLNQAKDAGITLTSTQTAELRSLGAEMAAAEIATARAKEAMDFAKGATDGFLSTLRQGLQNGEGFWKSFGNAAMGVLNKIVDRIQTGIVDALFSAQGAFSGGGRGLFGTLLGGLGSLLGFAGGGYTGSGAASAVAGVVHGQEYVFSAGATKAIGVRNLDALHGAAKGFAGGGYVPPVAPRIQAPANSQPQEVRINVNVTGARGNKEIEQMVRAGVAQGIGQYDKTLDRTIGGKLSANQARFT